MPVLGVYPGDVMPPALFRRDDQPASTTTINPEEATTVRAATKNSTRLNPAIIGAAVLVVICVVVAAVVLHRYWCRNPKCKVCPIIKCRWWKPWKGSVREKRLPNLPAPIAPFDETLDTPEKSGFDVIECSPQDPQFRQDGEDEPTLVIEPRLRELRYPNTRSTVSNATLITTPLTEFTSTAATSTVVSTILEPIAKSDMETVQRSPVGETHLPSNFSTTSFNTTRSRGSQALSVITLPSFITNDRPRPYSGGARMESPIRPYQRKRSSFFDHRFSGTDSAPPVSPVNDDEASDNGSRRASGALRIITSMLKRRGSTSSSSVRSSATSSRHSSRHFPRRPNLSLGAEDEAVIEWKRLPPLPSAHGTSASQTPQSRRATGVQDFPTERLPSYYENEPNPPGFLATHVPLPPSPSVLASPVSPLAYAPPSPAETPPIKGFVFRSSYPPLPPSIPPTPGSFGYPPLPPSIPSTPRPFSYPPLPPSIPSTPRSCSYPPLPPSTPPTPRSYEYPPLPPSIPPTPRSFKYPPLPPSIPSTPGSFRYPPLPPSIPSTPRSFEYPPLPPSIPPTPGRFSYPPTPYSADKFTDAHSIHAADLTVPRAIDVLHRLCDDAVRPRSSLNTMAVPENSDGFLFYGAKDDGVGRSIYRGSNVSAFSQRSVLREFALSPPLLTFPVSPSRPMSPKGPRPLPAPGQLSRSGTLYSQANSTGQ